MNRETRSIITSTMVGVIIGWAVGVAQLALPPAKCRSFQTNRVLPGMATSGIGILPHS